ncbi:MAG TPA: bacterial transcriptional activator domain-containing protein, partial [Geobacteraceae bacterium]
LSDLLWPDADGDRAHSSFTTTLSRLRLIIGLNKAIEFRDGTASLNPRYCWVDLRAFEEVFRELDSFLEQLEASGKSGRRSLSTVLQLAERAMDLYGGPLLPGESGHAWVAPVRDRVRDRFLSLVIRLGSHLETLEEWGKAARYYRMALDTDETVDEELFRRLMICHHRLGQPSRTMEVYRQCRKTLFSALGVEPSQKTQTLYRELIL